MRSLVNPANLHRTAKYFMDTGQVKSYDEAIATLERFGLTIRVGADVCTSVNKQNALLTLVNMARRTFLGGVGVVGLPDAPSLSPLAPGQTLRKAVVDLGGNLVTDAQPVWPVALIGDTVLATTESPGWRLTWGGWRGGVIPFHREVRLAEEEAICLAPLLASAACTAEVFSYYARDHAMVGHRSHGLSLWRPGADWLTEDSTEPLAAFLPSRLWIIGLGNLGQSFSWTLATLPYARRQDVQLVLQDFDRIAIANESTSLLTFPNNFNRKKTRVVAEWLERRGFETNINELCFGPWTRRGVDEPEVALCGVDNAITRASLGNSQFELVVEAGLGAGPEAFRNLSVHTFPSSRSPQEIWSRQVSSSDSYTENMPAYQELRRAGVDSCGVTQLASRTVGAPFVGLIAACLSLSELLRRLNGGCGYELVSCSAAALEDVESVSVFAEPYSFGHVNANRGETHVN